MTMDDAQWLLNTQKGELHGFDVTQIKGGPRAKMSVVLVSIVTNMQWFCAASSNLEHILELLLTLHGNYARCSLVN